jgi:hypothetical protein
MVRSLPAGLCIALTAACALGAAGVLGGVDGPGFAVTVSIAASVAPLAMLAFLIADLREQDEPAPEAYLGPLVKVPFDDTVPDGPSPFMADIEALGFAMAGRMPALNGPPQRLRLPGSHAE